MGSLIVENTSSLSKELDGLIGEHPNFGKFHDLYWKGTNENKKRLNNESKFESIYAAVGVLNFHGLKTEEDLYEFLKDRFEFLKTEQMSQFEEWSGKEFGDEYWKIEDYDKFLDEKHAMDIRKIEEMIANPPSGVDIIKLYDNKKRGVNILLDDYRSARRVGRSINKNVKLNDPVSGWDFSRLSPEEILMEEDFSSENGEVKLTFALPLGCYAPDQTVVVLDRGKGLPMFYRPFDKDPLIRGKDRVSLEAGSHIADRYGVLVWGNASGSGSSITARHFGLAALTDTFNLPLIDHMRENIESISEKSELKHIKVPGWYCDSRICPNIESLLEEIETSNKIFNSGENITYSILFIPKGMLDNESPGFSLFFPRLGQAYDDGRIERILNEGRINITYAPAALENGGIFATPLKVGKVRNMSARDIMSERDIVMHSMSYPDKLYDLEANLRNS